MMQVDNNNKDYVPSEQSSEYDNSNDTIQPQPTTIEEEQYEMFDTTIEKCWDDSTSISGNVISVSCDYSHDYEVITSSDCAYTYTDSNYTHYTIKNNLGNPYCIKSTMIKYEPQTGNNSNSYGNSDESYGYGDLVQGYTIVSTVLGCNSVYKKDGYEYREITNGRDTLCGEKYVGMSDSTNYNIGIGDTVQGYKIVLTSACYSSMYKQDGHEYATLTQDYKSYCGEKYVGMSDSTNYNVGVGDYYQGYQIYSVGSCPYNAPEQAYKQYYNLTINNKYYCGLK
jgi:hypothetical protein